MFSSENYPMSEGVFGESELHGRRSIVAISLAS